MSETKIIQGNASEVLKTLQSESISACVTSPPYWGLRAYGSEPQIWDDDPDCNHRWGERLPHQHETSAGHGPNSMVTSKSHQNAQNEVRRSGAGYFCQDCNAWKGELGTEPSPELFIDHLVAIFHEVKRVLRSDGVCWINIDDSYYAGNKSKHDDIRNNTLKSKEAQNVGSWHLQANRQPLIYPESNYHEKQQVLKPKDKCLVPERLTIALQNDGWWIRSTFPWIKGNSLPGSYKDRFVTSHEIVIMATKSKAYYFDADSVRKPMSEETIARLARGVSKQNKYNQGTPGQKPQGIARERRNIKNLNTDDLSRQPYSMHKARETGRTGDGHSGYYDANGNPRMHPLGAMRRTGDFMFESLDEAIKAHSEYLSHLIEVRENGGLLLNDDDVPIGIFANTAGLKESHYASFPGKLVAPLIKTGCPERCCPKCGKGWNRVMSKPTGGSTGQAWHNHENDDLEGNKKASNSTDYQHSQQTGWEPNCKCDKPDYIAGTVLDPFGGSGTIGIVASYLNRHSVLIELKDEYADMSEDRIVNDMPLFNTVN